MAASPYETEIAQWRADMETRLKAEDGWLSVAGLFWLNEGDTMFGSDASLPIKLPSGPARAGIFRYWQERVQVLPFDGVPILVNDMPVLNGALLQHDGDGPSDQVRLGDLTMLLIKRGDRIGVRLKDKNSPYRLQFTRRNWFSVDPAYRVEAKYQPYAKPLVRRVPTVLDGVVEDQEAIGTVTFQLKGQSLTLEALSSSPKQIWFVFRDQTAGKETYGAARFLYADMPKAGRTVLDFNKAYNPPCAFNPYTTCPLPVKQNILATRIEAGERKYDH